MKLRVNKRFSHLQNGYIWNVEKRVLWIFWINISKKVHRIKASAEAELINILIKNKKC